MGIRVLLVRMALTGAARMQSEQNIFFDTVQDGIATVKPADCHEVEQKRCMRFLMVVLADFGHGLEVVRGSGCGRMKNVLNDCYLSK